MSPRRSLAVVVPAVLALGLSASGASALQPAESSHRLPPPPEVRLSQLPEDSVVADGSVYDVAQQGDRVYALGSFDELGRYSGPVRILDGDTGADLAAPRFDEGQVSVAQADGSGGWFLGGDTDSGLVHVLADGSVDPDLSFHVNGLVSAIALEGDTLYIGGLFTRANGADRTNLAAYSASTGDLLAFHADQDKRVTELVADADTVWVGSQKTVTAISTSTGATRSTSTFDGPVHALALGDGVVYVGTDGLRVIEQDSGDAAPGFTDAVVDGTVHSLLLDGTRLYVGTDGTDGSSKLIAVNAATGVADPSFAAQVYGGVATFGAPGGVFDLALDGDRLWVAGMFTQAGGEAAHGMAVLDAATGAATDTAVPTFHKQVNAVEISGGKVLAGGHFYLEDATRTRGLAALDATTMQPVPGFRGRGAYRGGDLVLAPNAVYVATTHYLGFDRNLPGGSNAAYYWNTSGTVHAYDPDTGAPDPSRTHQIHDLTGVTTIGSSLVVAERLQRDVKFPRNRIIVFGPNGKKTHSYLVPLRGYITELDSIDGDLLLSGSFKRKAPNGGPRNTAMLRLDVDNGNRRPWFDPHIHGPVNDMTVGGNAIFASGLFTKVHEGLDQDRDGLTKMFARSDKSEEFDPGSMYAGDWDAKARVVGDLLWVDRDPQYFADATSGKMVDDPTGGLVRTYLNAVTGDAHTLVAAGDWYTSGLAGEGYLQVGFVAAFPH